jgi:hypothetical protein
MIAMIRMIRIVTSESDGTTHLPVTDDSGKPNHNLMGAAWAALHGGYRGNKYEGPDKDKAITELKSLYDKEGMEPPSEKAMQVEQESYEKMLKDLQEQITKAQESAQLVLKLVQKRAPKRDVQKSLYDVQQLACIIQQLGDMQMCLRGEKAYEGDASTAPAKLSELLQSLSAFFLELASEELGELNAAGAEAEAAKSQTKEEVALMKATIVAMQKLVDGATDPEVKKMAPHLKELGEHAEKIHKAAGHLGKALAKMEEAHDAMAEHHEKAMGLHGEIAKSAAALLGEEAAMPNATHDVSDAGRGESKEQTESGLGMAGNEHHEKMLKSGFAALEERLNKRSQEEATKNEERFGAIEKGMAALLKAINTLIVEPEAPPASQRQTQARQAETIHKVEKGAENGETTGGLAPERKQELMAKAKNGTITRSEQQELFKSVPMQRGNGPAPNLTLER